MAFAAPTKNKTHSTNLAKSTWTPMGNSEANLQVFEERRALIKKWFEKWSDKQRRVVVQDVFKSLSEKHLRSVHENLSIQFPQEKFDFTRRMPRVLTLYIFSFLDPRSLCRCAQVSWYWKYLTELDCIWRPKCLRFGWYPTHQPSQFEETIWKRHYIETLYKLNYVKAKDHKEIENTDDIEVPDTARTDRTHLSSARSNISAASIRKKKAHIAPRSVPLAGPKWEPPPWKGSDPHPTDTVRYNYLDNQQKSKRSKNPRRPKSAADSVPSSARKSIHSPVKSNLEPRPSTGPHHAKRSSVTQSFDPQALAKQNGGIKEANDRNMMSSSVSNFSHTGNSVPFGQSSQYNSFSGAPLHASTYYVNAGSPGRGTLNASTYHVGVNGPKPMLASPTLSPTQQPTLSLSPLTLKDAGQRPQPATRLSFDKTVSNNPMSSNPTKSPQIQPPMPKPVATISEYQVKSNGKSTPLVGNPWKPPENVSDDDF